MRSVSRHLTKLAAAAACVVTLCVAAIPAGAQTVTFPAWINDSFSTSNRYLRIWEYFRGNATTRFNIWTELGDPFNSGDDFFFSETVDNNGNITIVWPWGSRLWSGQRPTPRVGTSGDDRPYTNHLTLHVEDSTSMNGFTNLEFPEDGTTQFNPPVISLPDGQGFFAPYTFVTGGGAAGGGIDLSVNQKTQFARDLVRVEVVIRNNGGATRRVGARLLVDPYVDQLGPTKSVFFPKTRERVLYESEFKGAAIPDEWVIYDDDEGPNPTWVAKNILRGNGATTPARLVIGNTLDMFPFVEANGTYDWTVRPDLELRISDIGALIYWDPVSIPAGQTRSFVTYIGLGAASHGMSDAYVASQSQVSLADRAQGFIAAAQAPPALPLVNGNSDTQEATVHAFLQNEFSFSMPSTFAFIDLPDGLEFGSSDPTQSARKDFGSLAAVGTGLDEGTGDWTIQPNGIDAGQLAITVTAGNGFSDTARVTRYINVPQGRRYQFNNGWKMVTFPFSFTALQDDPADVFKELDGVTPLTPGSFRIVRYNPLLNAYEDVDQIVAGEGYWVRMMGVGTTDIRLGNQAQPIKLGTRDIFTSTLRRGWNQVGNPSPYTVRLRDLRFLGTGGIIVSYDTAISSGLIRPGIFQYNWKTGAYEQLNRDSLVKPGQGLWVFANSERNIVWPPPQGAGLSITP
jgi:hypothetical protein